MSLCVTSACPGGMHVGHERKPMPTTIQIPRRGLFDCLTPTEHRVIQAVIRVGMARAAAEELGISPRTVEVHMQNAKDKTCHATSLLMLLAYDRLTRKESN